MECLIEDAWDELLENKQEETEACELIVVITKADNSSGVLREFPFFLHFLQTLLLRLSGQDLPGVIFSLHFLRESFVALKIYQTFIGVV